MLLTVQSKSLQLSCCRGYRSCMHCGIVADAQLLSRVANDIQQAFSFSDLDAFKPVWIVIATWSNVLYSGATGVSMNNSNTNEYS